MIQRIQSVWLLVASLISAGIFMFGILGIEYTENGATVSRSITVLEYNNAMGYILAALAAVLVILPLITIFMFKDRKKQRSMATLATVLNIGFIVLYIISTGMYASGHTLEITSTSYGIASFLPLGSIIFLFMAIRGITSDIKAVKSLDRLR